MADDPLSGTIDQLHSELMLAVHAAYYRAMRTVAWQLFLFGVSATAITFAGDWLRPVLAVALVAGAAWWASHIARAAQRARSRITVYAGGLAMARASFDYDEREAGPDADA